VAPVARLAARLYFCWLAESMQRKGWIALLVGWVSLGLAAPALGAFPGASGRIAFDSDLDDGVQADVYVLNSDGSGQKRLTNNTPSDSDAGSAPDGSRITFASDRDGNHEIS
jgi:WD40 repeat protein